jgi:polyribonucleotide nucleotidyltransferase
MVEGEMNEVSEAEMLEAIKKAHEEIKQHCKIQLELTEAVGKTEKQEYSHEINDEELEKLIWEKTYEKVYEIVKSTLEGTVIMATWTLETGWVIQVQHESNLISVYKHNSELLKRVGDYVKVGEPIAIIGNSGELTTGPHLHFELWYNGIPLNPEDYISF